MEHQELSEALLHVALIESQTISVRLVEIIGYLERREHLAALGTFPEIEERFRYWVSVLTVAARLTRT